MAVEPFQGRIFQVKKYFSAAPSDINISIFKLKYYFNFFPEKVNVVQLNFHEISCTARYHRLTFADTKDARYSGADAREAQSDRSGRRWCRLARPCG